MTADFSADCIETLQAKSQWNNILKAIKEKKTKPVHLEFYIR